MWVLSLTANISENVATVKLYDNYAINSLLLHVTILSLWDIEDQLYRLWIEVNGVIHDHMPALIYHIRILHVQYLLVSLVYTPNSTIFIMICF